MSLLLAEFLARFQLKHNTDIGYSDSIGFFAQLRNISQWEGSGWLRLIETHPFFGYVMSTKAVPTANNYGFHDTQPFPYQRKSNNEYVIAVLGGSVALNWGEWIQNLGNDFFIATLKRKVPTLAQRKIVILNMAMWGFKQPQQLFIASYFLDSVDLFVNVEGHNELYAYTNHPVFPIEYPVGAHFFFSRSRQVVEASTDLRFLEHLNQALIETGTRHAWLAGSALYFSLVKSFSQWLRMKAMVAAEKAKKNYLEELQVLSRSFYSEDARRSKPQEAAIRIWEKFVLQQQRLLDSYGRKVIFFLQPNQYIPNSKPFSDWEKKNAIAGDYGAIAREFQLLPEAVTRLRKAKVNIFDLTMIFSQETETVYADICCHLNGRGNYLMSQAILEKASSTLKLP